MSSDTGKINKNEKKKEKMCMDFCHALTSQGLAFSFSLSLVSNFSFSLDTRKMALDTENETTPKKRKSPSTIRRNARRREEFRLKKQNPLTVLSTMLLQDCPNCSTWKLDKPISSFKWKHGYQCLTLCVETHTPLTTYFCTA